MCGRVGTGHLLVDVVDLQHCKVAPLLLRRVAAARRHDGAGLGRQPIGASLRALGACAKVSHTVSVRARLSEGADSIKGRETLRTLSGTGAQLGVQPRLHPLLHLGEEACEW